MGVVLTDNGKLYIENVRRVAWDTGEMCEYASCLISALAICGQNVPYHFVMGTSGVAFRFTLNPREWDFTNYSIRNVAPDKGAAIRRAFDAVGYSYALREAGSFQDDVADIRDSIDRGIPVIAFRVIGPSDCCILTGYDQEGQVLLGWSAFQDIPDDHNIPHDSTGYFRKPGWHENLPGYILIREKIERPPLHSSYLDALRWALHLLRAQDMKPKMTGLEALRVWADEMNQPQFFPAGDLAVIGQRYVSTAINMTMLRDHCSAEPFLRQVVDDSPDFLPELSRAIACYCEVRHHQERMDHLISDNFSESAMKAIHDPEIRRMYADAILCIRDAEEEAANQFAHLIERCG